MVLQICEIKDHIASGFFLHQLKLLSFFDFSLDTVSWPFTVPELGLVICPTKVESGAPGPAAEQGGNGWRPLYSVLQGTTWKGHFYHRLQFDSSVSNILRALHTVGAE